MDAVAPHIDVRALQVSDAPVLYQLDNNFETDCIFSLRVSTPSSSMENGASGNGRPVFSFSLVETAVDPPLYKDYRLYEGSEADFTAKVQRAQGGYVAAADGQIAGCILLSVEEWRSVARVETIIVGHQYRRYGIGSLLLNCAADWGRERDCWAIMLETQNTNYAAIQFYLRNGLEIWSINRHYYPPGPIEHEVAIMMGKRLHSNSST